jgi:hypothetical protein
MSKTGERLKALTKRNPDKSINSHEEAGLLLSHFLSFHDVAGARMARCEWKIKTS